METVQGDPTRWLDRELSEWDRRNDPNRRIEAKELWQLVDESKDTPDFWYHDMDGAYREGFEAGFDYALELVGEIYSKKGFTRVKEICSILWDWSDRVLRFWKCTGEGMYNKYRLGDEFAHPHMNVKKMESWSEIRQRIIRRDGKCVRCGDVIKLEVDHIVEVQDGGLPTDENLRTLCAVCHKGKKIWKSASC